MEYSFTCYGHENIAAKHKTTLEFTKDEDLSLKGDCIVGVKADFSLQQLKKFIKSLNNNKKITIIIGAVNNNSNNNKNNDIIDNDYNNKKITEKINAEINPNFNSDKEMVIRKSDFIDERTFAIKADKAAIDLDKDLIKFLKVKAGKMMISIEKA